MKGKKKILKKKKSNQIKKERGKKRCEREEWCGQVSTGQSLLNHCEENLPLGPSFPDQQSSQRRSLAMTESIDSFKFKHSLCVSTLHADGFPARN